MAGPIRFQDGDTGKVTSEWVIPDWAIYLGDSPSHCRSCGAKMLWVESVKNQRPAPINPDGTSHFATCPQADRWRKR